MPRDYLLLPIVSLLSAAYLVSLLLVKRKKLSFSKHIGIWNIALLSSFFVSAGLGVILVLRLGYGVNISLPFNMLYLHVVAGNVMATVSVFHLSWHLGYFKRLLRL